MSPFIADIIGGLFKRDSSPAPTPVASSPWLIAYSPNMPTAMSPVGDGTWYFDFPQSDGIHYVYRQVTESGRSFVNMRFRIDGSASFLEVMGTPGQDASQGPGKVRLYLQRTGDNMSGVNGFEHYRWWSPPMDLASGEWLINYTFDPALWTNVIGQNNAEGLQAALANLQYVGFTFGGMFAGHGVYAVGQARFVLLQYSIN